MPDGKTHLLKSWFEEVWNKGRESAIDEIGSPDLVAHNLIDSSGKPIVGSARYGAVPSSASLLSGNHFWQML